MNYRLLSKVLGLLLLLLSAAMAGCLAFAVLDHERKPGVDAVDSFVLSTGITAVAALVLLVLGRRGGREVSRKESITIVGLGWILCACFGALPFMFCTPSLSPSSALFESMSGFTTTGATVITDLSVVPRSIHLWRGLTQWLGGVGILVLFVALLSYLGVGSKALFRHESSANAGEGTQARIAQVAARLWQIYLALSVICCGGLLALGMGPYEAVIHSFTALSTGGFSTQQASISAFDSLWIELWLVLFMILGGISFMLYSWFVEGRWARWHKEEETKAYLLILATATVILAVNLVAFGHYNGFWQAVRPALFQVVSIMTTTGFVTEDYDQWPPLSRVVLLLLMFVGGCAGSTSGGIKVGRWLIFFKTLRLVGVSTFRPSQVLSVSVNGSSVDEPLQERSIMLICLAGVVTGLGAGLISLFEPGLDLVSSVAAVTATLFNIGPGFGAVGPVQDFSHLCWGSHLLLSGLMVLGRLEFLAVLVLFCPSLWKRY